MAFRFDDIVQGCKRCLSIAAANLAQHRLRLGVALAGIGVAILLLLLQLAFLHGVSTQAVRLYDDFDFDLALTPTAYQFLYSGGDFDRVRLVQTMADPDVAATFALNIGASQWENRANKQISSVLIIGLDAPGAFVHDSDIRDGYAALKDSRSVLADEYSAGSFGALATGTEAKMSDQPVDVVGHYRLGLFFYADGSVIVRNPDFAHFTGRDGRAVSVGFVRLVKGADPDVVKTRLEKALPDDVRLLTRDELIAQEQSFFIVTKPIGVMLRSSMWISFLVGAAILFQILSAEIVRRAKEFATLKAMGFGRGFVFGLGLAEILLLLAGAFLPTLVVAGLILWIIEAMTRLPVTLTLPVIAEALAIVLAMGVISGASVLGRISRADPAELFG